MYPLNLKVLAYFFAISLLLCPGQVQAQDNGNIRHQTVAADAPSRHDVLSELYKFKQQTLVNAYVKHGKHNDAWDHDAQELLGLFAILLTYGDHEMDVYTREPMRRALEEFRPLEKLIESVEQSRCNDPLILFLIGYEYAQNLTGRDLEMRKKTVEVLSRSIEGFDGAGYHPYWQYKCLTLALTESRKLGFSADLRRQRAPWHARVSSLAIEALKEASEEKSNVVCDLIVQQICHPIEFLAADQQPRQVVYVEQFIESLEVLKENDPWAYHAARATTLVDLAWMHRGTGFANQVKREQWQAFESCLKGASESFTAAWEERPSTHIANEMIVVAMGGHAKPDEDCRFWFERSVALMFDNPRAWQYMATSLLPRWGGSHNEMLGLAFEALKTGRFDTSTPEHFRVILQRIDDERQDGAVWKIPAVSDGLQRMAHEMASQRGEEMRLYYTVIEAIFMWKSQDFERVVAAIEQLGPLEGDTLAAAEQAFQSESYELLEVVGASYLMSSKHAEEVFGAYQLFREGNPDRAIASLEAVRNDAADLHKTGKRFLDRQISTIAFSMKAATGQWIDVGRPRDFESLWQPIHGTWDFDDQGRLIGQADENGLALIFQHIANHPWELACEFEIIDSAPEGWSNTGVIFAYQSEENFAGNWVFPQTSRTVEFRPGWNMRGRETRKKINPDGKQLLIHRHDGKGKVSVSIDGQVCVDFIWRWSDFPTACRFGLSSTKRNGPRSLAPEGFDQLKIRYSNIRFRMLGAE
ncbi:MAG: hypothetical protein AAGB26_02095 [Planctomycetota bacterium]